MIARSSESRKRGWIISRATGLSLGDEYKDPAFSIDIESPCTDGRLVQRNPSLHDKIGTANRRVIESNHHAFASICYRRRPSDACHLQLFSRYVCPEATAGAECGYRRVPGFAVSGLCQRQSSAEGGGEDVQHPHC